MFLTNSTFAALQHPIHSPTPLVLPTWWWPLRALGPIKVAGHACKVKARKPWNCQVTVPRPLESDDKSFVQRPFLGGKADRRSHALVGILYCKRTELHMVTVARYQQISRV